MIRRIAGTFLVVLLAATAAPALAGDEGGEIGFIGGFTFPTDDVTARFGESTEPELTLGVRGGVLFSPRWGWSVDGLYTTLEGDAPVSDADMITFRTGVDFFFKPEGDRRWYFTFGGGWSEVDYDGAGTDFDHALLSAGLGAKINVGDADNFRWEIRIDRSFEDDLGPFVDDVNTGHVLFSYSFGSAGPKTDADGDGVYDRRDRCPGTPRGATVDEDGCPLDGDGDGVFDGLDACPDTPAGWPVDARGCPKDTDGDGVPDGKDDCPDTPRGATVDGKGCPKDTDGDGVYDGLDRCPDTKKGARVDANGCAPDTDGDGVVDGIDRCPDTPKGATVDAAGCPKDTDGDGVFDGLDRCPGTPAGTKVDTRGCPELFTEEKKSLVLEGVHFELNKAVLTPNSRTILDRVAESLREWPEIRVEVGGHTDSTGSAAYNQKLSQERAQAVRDYLVSQGVSAAGLTVRGYGEEKPIADNGTDAGRATNRRVELKRLN